MKHSLVRDPLPEPKSSLPRSMRGSMVGVPLNMAPRANMDEPKTHRNENKKTPTGKR